MPFTPVSRAVLQRQCACGTHTMGRRECAECEKKQVNGKLLQTKLAISEPGDVSEREADRVVDHAMKMSPAEVSRIQHGHMAQRLVQRRTTSTATGLAEAPPIVHEVLRSPGQPLAPATRAFFEPAFGHDFSDVRVHADAKSEESARTINALAFTIGQNIHFGAGEYQPASSQGKRLLAHELAHTVQQRGIDAGTQWLSAARMAPEADHLEREADRAAEQVVTGGAVQIVGSAQTAVPQREDRDKKSRSQASKVILPVEPNKKQKGMIDEARRAAAIRAQIAMFKASGIQGEGPFLEARRLAQIKFDWTNPNMDQISEVLSGMGGRLTTVDIKVAGPGDPECGTRAGYVRGHRPPIVLCPGFYSDPGNNEGRIRTMIHEMAHIKGIGTADVAEQYFPIFDCDSKGTFESADSWANYVHCLSGQPPDKSEEIVVPKRVRKVRASDSKK